MNRAGLQRLGFEQGARLGGASEGAWSATAADGTRVVLKWFPDPAMAERYAVLLPGLATLRSRGVPVPDYLRVVPFDGGTLSAQRFLPGRPQDNPPPAVLAEIGEFVAAKAGIPGPRPAGAESSWGAFVVRTLTLERDGSGLHRYLRRWGRASAAVLDRVQAIGRRSDPDRFPDDGLVHLDLHTDNVLIDDGRISGIVDWEDACAGDHRYDLVQYAFDLDGHGQPVWGAVDAAGFEPDVLRAYLAFLVLKCTAAAIRDRPHDVARQLDRAGRVFERYGI